MQSGYTYSLNGTEWTGEFKTRKDARAAAMEAAHQQSEVPGEVYVGKIVAADPQITRHAASIIREMHGRADRMGVSQYLTGLKIEQVRDLDQALANTLGHWLDQYNLRPTQFSVESISEYPVPAPSAVKQPESKEVNDLGPVRETFV